MILIWEYLVVPSIGFPKAAFEKPLTDHRPDHISPNLIDDIKPPIRHLR